MLFWKLLCKYTLFLCYTSLHPVPLPFPFPPHVDFLPNFLFSNNVIINGADIRNLRPTNVNWQVCIELISLLRARKLQATKQTHVGVWKELNFSSALLIVSEKREHRLCVWSQSTKRPRVTRVSMHLPNEWFFTNSVSLKMSVWNFWIH